MARQDTVPRVVIITRPTEYTLLLRAHGTEGQARFFLQSRGQDLSLVQAWHHRQEAAQAEVASAIPRAWRVSRVQRSDLDRFLFEPQDIVIAVGQDGLVANVAKYLRGQRVLGVNPDPERMPGVLVPHSPAAAARLVVPLGEGATVGVEARTMVEARLDDGQVLLALNEVFVGHRSHQSARYRLRVGGAEERQSSSGLLVASGTGSTGWAASIRRERATPLDLPAPTDPALSWFVREAWPSRATGTTLTAGLLAGEGALEATSEMNEGGAIFGDGIEADALGFGWGATVRVGRAEHTLQLVRG